MPFVIKKKDKSIFLTTIRLRGLFMTFCFLKYIRIYDEFIYKKHNVPSSRIIILGMKIGL